MLQSQVAGRHGSYATQFLRASGAPHYRTRKDMRAAYSRKALNRRLVLPLDSHNWMRSLEVLNARYARLGRTPEHYQTVLRDMVQHHGVYADLASGPSPSVMKDSKGSVASVAASAADVLPAIDSLRDKAYAGEIPSNGSLWVTLVWSYCTLQQPRMALDAFHLARRRFRFSQPTLQHMAELLLPVLCQHGYLDDATALYEEYLKPRDTFQAQASPPVSEDCSDLPGQGTARMSSTGVAPRRSNLDDSEARRWLAEAAARQGDWGKTQHFATAQAPIKQRSSEAEGRTNSTLAEASSPRLTINSLFQGHESTHQVGTILSPPVTHSVSKPAPSARPPRSSLPVLSTLSEVAVRRLFRSLCSEAATKANAAAGAKDDNRFADALSCWEHLYGPLPTASTAINGTSSHDPGSAETDSKDARAVDVLLPERIRQIPPMQDIHNLLNLYALHGRWAAMLSYFTLAFLHRPATRYLDATPRDLLTLDERGAVAVEVEDTHHSGTASSNNADFFPYEADFPLDAVTLNLVFASLPKAASPLRLRTSAAGNQRGSEVLSLPAAARPITVVRLLDDLLAYRDDMALTDVVMSVVGPALLQLGQTERAFELLVRAPLMVRARERKVSQRLSDHEQELKSVLVSVGYAAYAVSGSAAQRLDMVRRMPHLFPPEVVRRLAVAAESNDALSKSSGELSAPFAVLEGPVVAPPPSQRATSVSPSEAHKCDQATPPSAVNTTRSFHRAHTSAAPSLLDLKWQHYNNAVERKQRDGGDALCWGDATHAQKRTAAHTHGRSSATLTTLAEDAMRRDYLHLQQTRHLAFTGSAADADRDPRPIPKGLHDHASGWDFYGRGGEKVFPNSKRTPNPHSMQPKVMRDLRNPFRGWNPRQNSSLAHKENVIKWNGKSAV